jgi:hypothetical protein
LLDEVERPPNSPLVFKTKQTQTEDEATIDLVPKIIPFDIDAAEAWRIRMSQWGNFDKCISDLEPKAKIWRYLDLPKFIDMFVKRRIYLRRADQFLDAFEGMPTFPLRDYIYASYKELENEIPGSFDGNPIAHANDALTNLRKLNFINCWYFGNYESAAMWSLYSQVGSGIAVQSTVQRLRDAMPIEAYIGKVKYVDYSVANIDPKDDLRSVLFLKRNHFEHEREVRVVLPVSFEKSDSEKIGHYVDIDLSELIEVLIISPKTPLWLHESVNAFMDTVGFSNKIKRSELDMNYLESAQAALRRE